MTAPFIFVGTHRVKPGKRDDFMEYFTEFCTGVVEPNEPRLHSFFGYTAPDSDLVTVVQVHPDADSMATHMRLIFKHIGEAYADYLEPESTVQIYGTISDELAQTIAGASQGSRDAVTIREPFAGFSRLPSAEPRR
ncbi:putative quinol monooxygenase [Cellulomonas sp. Leaf395]|uniref:putative quinol monooxygenase n=1 Tax=Cellulomonas sp. Leaf395 TaxID=1736362 RepID=UPI0006F2A4FA|nr:hypothetical protein [Cellulomonas sp. Leaf395]KQS97406.1 hypothetical protein ASG23_17905 [Cellulomonas sp. Leaf395]